MSTTIVSYHYIKNQTNWFNRSQENQLKLALNGLVLCHQIVSRKSDHHLLLDTIASYHYVQNDTRINQIQENWLRPLLGTNWAPNGHSRAIHNDIQKWPCHSEEADFKISETMYQGLLQGLRIVPIVNDYIIRDSLWITKKKRKLQSSKTKRFFQHLDHYHLPKYHKSLS